MAASLLALTRAATGTLFNSSFCESLLALTQVASNGGLSESLLVFTQTLFNCSFYESLTGNSGQQLGHSHGFKQLEYCPMVASLSLYWPSHR